MNMDATALTVTGVIATILSLTFALAAHVSCRRRNQEKKLLERMLADQHRASSPPSEATAARMENPTAATVYQEANTKAPDPVNPTPIPVRRRPVFIPPAVGAGEQPRTNGTPSSAFFKRFVVHPESATIEPVEETSQPDDQEKFIWE